MGADSGPSPSRTEPLEGVLRLDETSLGEAAEVPSAPFSSEPLSPVAERTRQFLADLPVGEIGVLPRGALVHLQSIQHACEVDDQRMVLSQGPSFAYEDRLDRPNSS